MPIRSAMLQASHRRRALGKGTCTRQVDAVTCVGHTCAMPPPDLSLEEITKFGIRTEDEGLHPFDPRVEWWNESWFWDWFDDAGTTAGHCRIGLFPAQQRAWVWFFLYHRGEWVAVEEPRLPLGGLQLARLAYDGWGLGFAY